MSSIWVSGDSRSSGRRSLKILSEPDSDSYLLFEYSEQLFVLHFETLALGCNSQAHHLIHSAMSLQQFFWSSQSSFYPQFTHV